MSANMHPGPSSENALPGKPANPNARLAPYIEHTRLVFDAQNQPEPAIAQLVREARQYGFKGVCVRPEHLRFAQQGIGYLKLISVIGFPPHLVPLDSEKQKPTIGNFSTKDKLAEIDAILSDSPGCINELDIVLNVGLFKQESPDASPKQTLQELRIIRDHTPGILLKLIIETDLLNEDEIILASKVCADAGFNMVKTSTGMVTGGLGAQVPHVRIIREFLDQYAPEMGIKASGGIKTPAKAWSLIQAGANCLGTSSGIQIVTD